MNSGGPQMPATRNWLPATPVALLRIDREIDRHTAHPRHLHAPLDLKYLQAMIERELGGRVPIVDGWLKPFSVADFVAEVLSWKPRIVVIRGVSWCLRESLAVGIALRRAGVITIAVGQQVAHHRAAPLAGWDEAFDHAIPGEPERAVAERVGSLLGDGERPMSPAPADSTNSRCDSRADEAVAPLRFSPLGSPEPAPDFVVEPAVLPPQRIDRDELAAYPFPFPLPGLPALQRFGYLMTAWGCPRPCRHCTGLVRRSVARPLRERSIDAVIAEANALRDAGAQMLLFEDDTLFVHRSRFLELAEALVARGPGLPWIANARPDELDEARVAAAARAGAVLLKIGVETGSPRQIVAIGKASDGEAWIAASEQAFALLRRHRIGSVGLFMVGLPGETPAEAEQTLSLALRLAPSYLQIQAFRAYPDIGLWPELPESVRAAASDSRYHYVADYDRAGANCSAIDDRTLAALPTRFYRRFYLRPSFAIRHLLASWRHYATPRGVVPAMRSLAYLLGWRRTRSARAIRGNPPASDRPSQAPSVTP